MKKTPIRWVGDSIESVGLGKAGEGAIEDMVCQSAIRKHQLWQGRSRLKSSRPALTPLKNKGGENDI